MALRDLVLNFFPLFIAMDALGTLPIVLSLEEGMKPRAKVRVIHIALITASIIGVIFLFLGRAILGVLGITVSHFAIAGGLVLLALALKDLVMGKLMDVPSKEEMIAFVPIGTPLTVGPATLTTLLLLSDQYSTGLVLFAFALNIVVAWLVFLQGNWIASFLGQGGLKAVSKVASLLLAAIAVKMMLAGLLVVLEGI